MEVSYEVSKLFQAAFGINSPVFLPISLKVGEGSADIQYRQAEPSNATGASPFSDISFGDTQPVEKYSWMGTPVAFPWQLKGGTYKVFDPSGALIDYALPDFDMPYATLITFEHPKIITRTRLSGNNGSVKEMYGFDDWEMVVRGICLTDHSRQNAKTAAEQKRELLKWDKICTSVNVLGELFFEKDIHALSLGNMTFTQLEGKPDVMPFEFRCYSDERLELIL